MRKKPNTRWMIIAPAIFFAILPQQAHAADALVNPNFAFDGGGWDGARFTGTGNDACAGGEANIGTWTVNALSFSYVLKTVAQTVTISTPSTVSFTWSSQNRSDASGATATVTLADADQSLSSGSFISSISGQSGSIGPIETTTNDEVVTINISGKDSVGWAGCYGTQFTVSALDVVPVSPPTTITTTTTSTTVPETTTTVPETTTTTTQPPETTTSTSTTTETTSLPPETTTTPVATTTTVETVPPTTTTTTTTTEVPTTTTSEPPPIPIDTTSTIPKPPVTIVPTSVLLTTTTETLPLLVNTSTTPVSVEIPPTTTTSPAVVAALAVTEGQTVTPAEAVALINNPNLAELPAAQIAAVFQAIDESTLTTQDIVAITESLVTAPTNVKEAFEKEVDIFKSGFDDYVPTGSNIPVGQRRTLVAIGAVLVAMPSGKIRRK